MAGILKDWECPICHSKKYCTIVIRFGIQTKMFPDGTSREEHDMKMCDDCEVLFGNPEKFRAPRREGGIEA